MKYKNIAISGEIGTGKSTLGTNLANSLGWKFISGGEFIRKWYKDNNVSLEETSKVPEDVDRKLEGDFQKLLGSEGGIVAESRLAGWLARDFPQTLKILVKTDFDVAMQRGANREGISKEEMIERSKIRSKGLKEKFKRLYDVDDFLDEKYFDLVLDTTTLSPHEVLEKALEKLKS